MTCPHATVFISVQAHGKGSLQLCLVVPVLNKCFPFSPPTMFAIDMAGDFINNVAEDALRG